MKKRDVVELIRYHAEHNEPGFKVAAYTVLNVLMKWKIMNLLIMLWLW